MVAQRPYRKGEAEIKACSSETRMNLTGGPRGDPSPAADRGQEPVSLPRPLAWRLPWHRRQVPWLVWQCPMPPHLLVQPIPTSQASEPLPRPAGWPEGPCGQGRAHPGAGSPESSKGDREPRSPHPWTSARRGPPTAQCPPGRPPLAGRWPWESPRRRRAAGTPGRTRRIQSVLSLREFTAPPRPHARPFSQHKTAERVITPRCPSPPSHPRLAA